MFQNCVFLCVLLFLCPDYSSSISTPEMKLSKNRSMTCSLPFSNSPCRKTNMFSCHFSRNSTNLEGDCDDHSQGIIFITNDFELLLISKYTDLIIKNRKLSFKKIIIQLERVGQVQLFSFFINIPTVETEMCTYTNLAVVILAKSTQSRSQVTGRPSGCLPISTSLPLINQCEKQFLANKSIQAIDFVCPFDVQNSSVCGKFYACLDSEPCHFAGYQKLVCRTNQLTEKTIFTNWNGSKQLDSIFIDINDNTSFNEHGFFLKLFENPQFKSSNGFITKNVFIVIKIGLLQIDRNLIEYSKQLNLNIEHGFCGIDGFQLDLIDRMETDVPVFMRNLDVKKRSKQSCFLNLSHQKNKEKYSPKCKANWIPSNNRSQPIAIVLICRGLHPYDIRWFRNGKEFTPKPSTFQIMNKSIIDMTVNFYISRDAKSEKSIHYYFNINNRLGSIDIYTRWPMAHESYSIQSSSTRKLRHDSFSSSTSGFHTTATFSVSPIQNQTQQIFTNAKLNHNKKEENQRNESSSWTSFEFFPTTQISNISVNTVFTVLEPLFSFGNKSEINVDQGQNLFLIINCSQTIAKAQWFFNEQPIEKFFFNESSSVNRQQATLEVKNVSGQHSGNYKVQLWNATKQMSEKEFHVRVRLFVEIDVCTFPKDLNRIFFESIECRFRAQDPKIRWIDSRGRTVPDKNATTLIDSNAQVYRSTLPIKDLKLSNNNFYTIEINSSQTNIKHTINFTIHDTMPIIFDSNFTNETIYLLPNTSVSFFANINGVPWPNVTLFHNDHPIIHDPDLNSTHIVFEMEKLPTLEDDMYYMKISNKLGSIETSRIKIRQVQIPVFNEISNESAIVVVHENETVHLQTPNIVRGTSNSLNVLWLVKDQILKTSLDRNSSRAEILLNATLQQSLVACIIQNELGSSTYFFNLKTHSPPKFLLELKNITEVELGQSIALTIIVLTSDLPNVTWYHQDQLLLYDGVRNVFEGDIFNHSMIIENITEAALGNYRALIETKEKCLSTNTRLIVVNKPTSVDSTTTMLRSSLTIIYNSITTTRTTSPVIATITSSTMTTIDKRKNLALRIVALSSSIILIFVLFLPVICDKERLGHCCRCRRPMIDRDETERTEIQSGKIEESVAF